MVVREAGDWTLVLEPKARLFHMEPADSDRRAAPHPGARRARAVHRGADLLVPRGLGSGGVLAFQWAPTRVAIPLAVEPSLAVQLPEAEAAPYLGRWSYQPFDEKGKALPPIELRVLYEDGVLKAEHVPLDGYMKRFALIRVRPDLFFPGLYDKDGKIYEVMRPDMAFTFTRAGGRPDSLEVRYDDDVLAASAKRIR
jgi:hypothetical protein